MSLSKRGGIRAGYAAVIAVLVLSAVEAYHIQVGVSEQQLEIYRHYVDQERSVATIRRNLWQASVFVRVLEQPQLARSLFRRVAERAVQFHEEWFGDTPEKISVPRVNAAPAAYIARPGCQADMMPTASKAKAWNIWYWAAVRHVASAASRALRLGKYELSSTCAPNAPSATARQPRTEPITSHDLPAEKFISPA